MIEPENDATADQENVSVCPSGEAFPLPDENAYPAEFEKLEKLAAADGHRLLTLQSNAEHTLIDRVQLAAREDIDFILINPAAFTHTSVAILDALNMFEKPIIELHISNIHAREEFKRHSKISAAATAVPRSLCGCSDTITDSRRGIERQNHSITSP